MKKKKNYQRKRKVESGKPSENMDYSRRFFVGNFANNTEAEDLIKYFSKFGKIIDSEIIYDKQTGDSKLFGFVFCQDMSTVNKILSRQHKLKGRILDVNTAFQKEKIKRMKWKIKFPDRKLFVVDIA